MYLNKKQVVAINTAIHIMSTVLANGIGEDYDEVSEATDTLIQMVATAKQAKIETEKIERRYRDGKDPEMQKAWCM